MASAADFAHPEAAGEPTQSSGFVWCVSLAPGHGAVGAAHLLRNTFRPQAWWYASPSSGSSSTVVRSLDVPLRNSICKMLALHRSSSGCVARLHRYAPLV